MLSTLSSFLPSALTDRLDKLDLRSDAQQSRKQDVEPDVGAAKPKDTVDESNKKEKKKKSMSNETFIVVRPPPAKSNHPLNLQLQLVPAHHSRDRSNSVTLSTPNTPTAAPNTSATFPPSPVASETDHGQGQGHDLKRTPSTRSNRSETSTFYASTSAGSVTSFASTTSTTSASSRRMIIPLYNLHAHNVMTNTILDAGTDARVAKFHKRGLEIIGLGVFEPTEVWMGKEHGHGAGVGAGSDALGVAIHRTNSQQSYLALPGQGHGQSQSPSTSQPGSRAATPEQSHSQSHSHSHSPESSRVSISSDYSNNASASYGGAETFSSFSGGVGGGSASGTVGVSTPTGAKRLFGKIFKKKDSSTNTTANNNNNNSSSSPLLSPVPAARHAHAEPTSPRTHITSGSPTGLQHPEVLQQRPSTPSTPTPGNVNTSTKGSHATSSSNNDILLPAVLGLSPLLSSATNPPTGRAVTYVWAVRKWLKAENHGIIAGVLGKIGREASVHGINVGSGGMAGGLGREQNSGVGVWTVRFEWQRGKSKSERAVAARKKGKRSSGMAQGSRTPSRRSSTVISEHGGGNVQDAVLAPAITLDSPRESLEVDARPNTRRKKRRGSSARRRSVSSVNRSDEEGYGNQDRDDERDGVQEHDFGYDQDDGVESDPEDSETPWTCYMILEETPRPPSTNPSGSVTTTTPTSPSSSFFSRGHSRKGSANINTNRKAGSANTNIIVQPSTPTPTHTPTSTPGNSYFRPPSLRAPTPTSSPVKFKVATLSPAPHHPKVVCQLKVPFPLPDVEVETGVVCKRVVRSDGSQCSTLSTAAGRGQKESPPSPLTLTGEEIKDIVCSTAFWIVVREGIGGVGKVSRKGDGWRIRG